jgi:predicted RNA-binding protein with PIN domain
MHLESVVKPKTAVSCENAGHTATAVSKNMATDEELLKIFEHTYGKIERKNPNTTFHTPKTVKPTYRATSKQHKKYDKEYLLIDGYNIIFAWDDLKELAKENLEAARSKLIERIAGYKIFKDFEVIVVFDAYKVKVNRGEVENIDGICVVYTKEAQTADSYIEKTAKELSKNYKVTVATSDGLEQIIIFGSGALRLSANALRAEVESVEANVRSIVEQCNIEAENLDFLRVIREKLEEIEKG